MRHSIPIIFVLFCLTFVFAAPIDQIPNLQQPRTNVFTSGQPTETGFRLIADTGVNSVINVLPERECLINEKAIVAANQMIYYHLPFETAGFRKETFEQFAQLMKKAEKPVLIHCSTGNHVGGLWFGYRVLIERVSLPVALIEARQIGMKPALENTLIDWLVSQRLQAGP